MERIVVRTVQNGHEELSHEELDQEYERFLKQGKSECFAWGYVASSKHVLCIDSHISFCILDQTPSEFPWKYITRGVYLADVWWFDDEEIVKDATTLTLVDFLQKYS